MLLLSGCASGQLASWLPATDPRIDQAPMRADTKSEARKYFNKPNPKAFAFSPEKGTYWAQWGSPTLEGAKESAMRKCEETTRTPCLLFAVNNEIVWQPTAERPVPGAREDKVQATSVASGPAALVPQATDPVDAPAVAPEVLPPAARSSVHLASVRDPADVSGEWQRLAKRHQVLADLELQAPRKVEVPGKGIFYRVIGGAFATRAEAQAVCERLRSAGRYCTIVVGQMTREDFAEALARLVDEGEAAGLDLPEMIEALEDQAVTMWISVGGSGANPLSAIVPRAASAAVQADAGSRPCPRVEGADACSRAAGVTQGPKTGRFAARPQSAAASSMRQGQPPMAGANTLPVGP